jgi:hypothetical protein
LLPTRLFATRLLAVALCAVIAACGSDAPVTDPVRPPLVRGIAVAAAAAEAGATTAADLSLPLVVGLTLQLRAVVTADAGASDAVAWASDAPAVATVSSAGLVSALAPGRARITATSVATPSVAASAAVTVAPRAVQAVSITPAVLSLVVGDAVQLVAAPRDSAGRALTGVPVTWTSDQPGVAAVDGAGLVRGITEGSARVIALAEGRAATAVIRVVTATASAFRVLTSGRPLGGVARRDGGAEWPYALRVTASNEQLGTWAGEIEWPTLSAVHRVEGTALGPWLTFKEVAYVKRGNAALGCTYALQLEDNGTRASGRWGECASQPQDGGSVWLDVK